MTRTRNKRRYHAGKEHMYKSGRKLPTRSYFVSFTLKQNVVEDITEGENTLELEVLIYHY